MIGYRRVDKFLIGIWRGLSDIDCLEWMPEPDGDFSNRWLSVVRLNPHNTKISPKDLISKLDKVGIEARHVWKPMHLQPLFEGEKYFRHSDDDFCKDLFETGLCLPSSSSMTVEQLDFIISEIREVLS